MKEKKHIYIEALRIFACFFVIFNHTNRNGFFLFSQTPVGSIEFWIYLFISVFCKFAVPIFFAISGVLYLNRKEESLKKIWFKKIFRIAIALIIVSFAFYLYDVCKGIEQFNIKNFFMKLFANGFDESQWYLYAYIAFLMSLPFLRPLAQNMSNRSYYYMIVLAIISCGIIPIVEYYLWQGNYHINSSFKLGWIMSNIVLYPLVGYFIHYRIDIKRKHVIYSWIINVICIILACITTYYNIKITGICNPRETQLFHSSFSIVNNITIFITFKYIFEKFKLPELAEKVICSLGKCTFGIYLIHIFVLYKNPYSEKVLNYLIYGLNINMMIAAFIYCFIIMTVCTIIIYILRKLPVLRKII